MITVEVEFSDKEYELLSKTLESLIMGRRRISEGKVLRALSVLWMLGEIHVTRDEFIKYGETTSAKVETQEMWKEGRKVYYHAEHGGLHAEEVAELWMLEHPLKIIGLSKTKAGDLLESETGVSKATCMKALIGLINDGVYDHDEKQRGKAHILKRGVNFNSWLVK